MCLLKASRFLNRSSKLTPLTASVDAGETCDNVKEQVEIMIRHHCECQPKLRCSLYHSQLQLGLNDVFKPEEGDKYPGDKSAIAEAGTARSCSATVCHDCRPACKVR